VVRRSTTIREEEQGMTTPADPVRPAATRPGAAATTRTLRTDRWWLAPLSVGVVLLFFILYSTVRIFMARWYWVDDYGYLTPLYSPCMSDSCAPGSSHLGTPLPELPFFLPLGIIAFPIVAGFRVTCYYYRKAGYRSLWLAPPACAVLEPHKRYTGETRFPLILMNSHRYFFYFAALVLVVNTYDAVLALLPESGGVGIGLGTVIMWVNLVLLAGYTVSCHACRHVVGGRLRNFSAHPVRYRLWTLVSRLNARHSQFAMISLFTVVLTDFYIMAVAAGWISDPRFVN
jgi:hypothetical protein